jgi:His-Xaa-Ser system radical SAM maturase HxsB
MSRFQPIEFYQRTAKATYQLLPFRFAPLDDVGIYALTNLAGEHLVVSAERLQQLVRHELPTSSPDYEDLRARHFLYDDSSKLAPDLLALKVRSRYRRLADFTALHIFVVTLRCEHSCPYCQVSRQTQDTEAFDMSRSTADNALELVFRSPSRAIKIEFQGGEPLLNFDLIRYIVRRASTINLAQQRDLQFVIATNLAVVTDEMLVFCRDYGIHLSTSLDGPEDLHNKNRPRPGRNSHGRVVEGIERARRIVGRDSVSALMTTTAESLGRVRDIIDEYVRLGFPGIFLRPLSPYGFAVKTNAIAAYDTDRWVAFYKEGLEYILALNKAGIAFREFYTSVIARKILTADDSGFVDLMSPAGLGIKAIVYNYDGDVYASDESRMLAEMGDHTFRLGTLGRDSYSDILLSDALLDPLEESFSGSAPMCEECAFEPYCGADPVFHHATQHDFVGRKAESAFCQRSMAMCRHVIGLMRKESDVKRIFLRWANG